MNEIPCFSVSTGDGAYAIDSDQRIVFWNAAAKTLLGYSSSEILGQFCWEILQGCSPGGKRICRQSCPLMHAMQRGELLGDIDLVVRHRDGSPVSINVSSLVCGGSVRNDSTSGERYSGFLHLFRVVEKPLPKQSGTLRISLMGPTLVEFPDGTQVDGSLWRRVKVRGLLALLVLRHGKPIERGALVHLLWPDLDRQAALRNLNTTVYNLRHSLEPQLTHGTESSYIFYRGGKYWFSSELTTWVDIDVFRQSIARAREATQVDQAIELYRSAVELRRGELLADLRLAGVPALPEISQLNQLYLTALEDLGVLYSQIDENEAASALFERVLTLDPGRQSAMQHLIRLTRNMDERATALAYCQRLVSTLQGELDMLLREESIGVSD